MSKKKTTPKRKKKPARKRSQGSKFALVMILGGILALGGLLAYFGIQPPPPEPIEKIRISTYEDVNRLVEEELLAAERSAGWRRLEAPGELVRLQMFGDYPESTRLMELATRIALTNSPAQLDLAPRKGIVRIFWQGEARLELRYQVSEQVRAQRPRIAIIMDDMGRNLAGFRNVLALTLPVTPAILPQTSFATQGAGILKSEGHEYMLHLPMEPRNYPAISPGEEALLVSLDAAEIRRRLQHYLQRVPGAIGGNNHMGSRFTEDRAAMRVVLEEMKASGLFFIDSRTIGGSVAFDEARRLGMKTAQRNIFLDNEEDVAYISRQLRKMVKIAEEKGVAIAICHPYPETFRALRQNENWLRAQPVDYVMASELVQRY